MKFTWTSLLYWFRLYRLCQMYRHILEHFILFGVSGTAKAPSGFNATAAGGVYKAYLTSYIKWFVYTIWPDVHLPKYIHSHSDVRLLPTFDHFPEVRSSRNRSRICIFEKVTSGHRSRGRPKSGSTGTGDKLVILVHFFAQNLSPPTVLIGEC